ncbi:hypothetical protein NDU88_011220 [Pleurodeles waltl]|uniref:Uncharacterized protein n=1 Tax=Pleurodeles waltl TaxID=8319 RepID=A0AAV7R0S8_PLEWA|nr:hypothetical protein NDU88_011220 [Pleurodeles waltl]
MKASQEGRSQRNNVRIVGLSEHVKGPNIELTAPDLENIRNFLGGMLLGTTYSQNTRGALIGIMESTLCRRFTGRLDRQDTGRHWSEGRKTLEYPD